MLPNNNQCMKMCNFCVYLTQRGSGVARGGGNTLPSLTSKIFKRKFCGFAGQKFAKIGGRPHQTKNLATPIKISVCGGWGGGRISFEDNKATKQSSMTPTNYPMVRPPPYCYSKL